MRKTRQDVRVAICHGDKLDPLTTVIPKGTMGLSYQINLIIMRASNLTLLFVLGLTLALVICSPISVTTDQQQIQDQDPPKADKVCMLIKFMRSQLRGGGGEGGRGGRGRGGGGGEEKEVEEKEEVEEEEEKEEEKEEEEEEEEERRRIS
ncbi:hypothetical protein PoB_002487900 [Plakobranchus ocellatus]|uniref:Uncharacterized protein n=1 Tax=Plakobranchus ocellatus TaxID=259542 RepID=A0AAV3ZVC1_9GAST|nr:hypothetical protein PoB_002487900 [Plakobranchus ocellatus]